MILEKLRGVPTVPLSECDDFDIIENAKDGQGFGVSNVREVEEGGFLVDLCSRRLRVDTTTLYEDWYAEAMERGGAWHRTEFVSEAILEHLKYWRQEESTEVPDFVYLLTESRLSEILAEGLVADRIFVKIIW